ncbi:class I SAM-dependent methyltransferase [Methylobacterium oryzae CBMB20]
MPTLNHFFNAETAEIVRAQNGPASLITAAGVFFHLEELHSVVKGIVTLLKPDGVFVVQAIYLGGMIENTAFDQIYHEHLCYYTLRSLEQLFARHGLEVFDVSVVPVHGGSLEAHVGFPGAHPVSDAVKRMRADEEARGYGKFETYVGFAENVRRLQAALLDLLERMHAEGKTVHAYGAPAKGATLLNAFGIGPRLVQVAAEKNPLKFGRLIPGARIPIVEEGSVPAPDAYLVLAWNFIDEFLARERRYLENGGAFIVPVPELKVITAADLPKAF